MATLTERLALLITADGKGAVRELEKVGKTADTQLGRATSKTDRWASRLTTLGVGLTSVAAAGALGLFKLGQSASNLEQAVGGTEAVFGDASGAIEDFAKTSADSWGLSQRSAREATSRIGALLKGMGFATDVAAEKSVELTQVGADLAATFGGTVEDAITAVAAALRGERDPIERYGVAFKEADVNARVLALGLDTSTFAAEKNAKAIASLDLIFEQTAGAQGQFAREADTAAGAQARFSAQMEDLKANIGAGVLPVMTSLFEKVGGVAEAFNKLDPEVQKSIGSIGTVAAISSGSLGALSLFAGAVLKGRQRLIDLNQTLPKTATLIKGVGGAATAVAGLVVLEAALTAIESTLGDFEIQADRTAVALEHLVETGVVQGRLRDLVGDVEDLDDIMRLAREDTEGLTSRFANFVGDPLTTGRTEINRARNTLEELDQALVAIADASGIPAAEEAFDALAKAAGLNDTQIALLRSSLDDYGGVVEDAGLKTGKTADKMDDTSGKMRDLGEDAEDAEKHIRGLIDAVLGLSAAQDGGIRAADELDDALFDWGDTLDQINDKTITGREAQEKFEDAALDVRAAIRDVAKAAKDTAEQEAILQGKTLSARDAAAVQRDALLKLRDSIAPSSPFRKFLDELIAQLDNAARNRTGTLTIDLNLPTGVSLGAALGGNVVLGKAHGGPVSAGSPYVVGERGPELFVPGSSGTIIPNGRGGVASMNVTIVQQPGEDADSLVAKFDEWYRTHSPRPWMN